MLRLVFAFAAAVIRAEANRRVAIAARRLCRLNRPQSDKLQYPENGSQPLFFITSQSTIEYQKQSQKNGKPGIGTDLHGTWSPMSHRLRNMENGRALPQSAPYIVPTRRTLPSRDTSTGRRVGVTGQPLNVSVKFKQHQRGIEH